MERRRLQRFFTLLSDLVQRDEFHQSLINLKLLEVNQSGGGAPDPGTEKCGCTPDSESGTDADPDRKSAGCVHCDETLSRKAKLDVLEKDLSEMDEVDQMIYIFFWY